MAKRSSVWLCAIAASIAVSAALWKGGWVGSWLDHSLSLALALLGALLAFYGPRLWRNAESALILLSSCLGARYLLWRGLYTLNLETPWSAAISLVVYLAEFYGLSSMILFYVQVMRPAQRPALETLPADLPSVDILVSIFNEPAEILLKTLVGCRAIDYPENLKNIYVLDDGGRREIRALAGRMGCRYLARGTNIHAKAGNVNYGLARSSGDLVLILDCDHIPVRSFLRETVGHFSDPKVAIVQTPHYFYNLDAFQRNHQLETEVANEQDLFFFVIQPGRDHWNSAFFAGSSGIFRRGALEAIGGIQTRTICEDLHTSMVLHAQGHKSVYVNKILSAGLSPDSFRGYIKQRQRWTRGGLQMFLMDNPLRRPGLSFMQRVNYFAAIYYFWSCVPRVIHLAAPLSFFLLGIAPLLAPVGVLASYFLPYYLCSLAAFLVASKGFRAPFWSDVYETATCFALSWTALKTLLNPKESRFEVTPKGERFQERRLEWTYILPHTVLAVLLLFGLETGGYKLFQSRLELGPLLISGLWTLYNLAVLLAAIIVAEQRPHQRVNARFRRRVRCEAVFDGQALPGRTANLSESGAALAMARHAPMPKRVALRLFDESGEVVETQADVIRNEPLWTGRGAAALRFADLDEERRESLIRLIYASPESWHHAHKNVSGPWDALVHMFTALPRHLSKDAARWKRASRHIRRVPCELLSDGKVYAGVTNDIGTRKMSLSLQGALPPRGAVTVRLRHDDAPALQIEGRVIRRLKHKGSPHMLVVRFTQRKDKELMSLLTHHD